MPNFIEGQMDHKLIQPSKYDSSIRPSEKERPQSDVVPVHNKHRQLIGWVNPKTGIVYNKNMKEIGPYKLRAGVVSMSKMYRKIVDAYQATINEDT